MNKKLPSLFSIVILFSSVVGCAKKQETVFINIDDSIVTSATAREAIEEAIKYDDKILVEEVVDNMTELNCSVLGSNSYMETSAIEQVMGKDATINRLKKSL